MVHRLDDVVTGALEVLDAYGLEFCSMRRVAGHLDVQPSALYHHVPDKQTLLALMADRIVASVAAPETGAPVERAAELCRALRGAMLSIRDGAEVVATASAFRLGASGVEAELSDLVGADGARTLLLYTFGQSQATQTHRMASAVGVVAPDDDLDDSFDRGLAIVVGGLDG